MNKRILMLERVRRLSFGRLQQRNKQQRSQQRAFAVWFAFGCADGKK